MASQFSETLRASLESYSTYLKSLSEYSGGVGSPPSFPFETTDSISILADIVRRFSGFQSTYSESSMNREIEGIRGLSRASATSSITRDDFYAMATTNIVEEYESLDISQQVLESLVDAKHPAQTGGIR